MVEVVDEFELGNYRSGGWLEPLQLSGNYKTTPSLLPTTDSFLLYTSRIIMQPSTFKHKVSIEGVSREGFITAHDPVKPTNRLSD